MSTTDHSGQGGKIQQGDHSPTPPRGMVPGNFAPSMQPDPMDISKGEGTGGFRKRKEPEPDHALPSDSRMARLQQFLPLVLSTATNGLDNYWQAVFEKELCAIECALAAESAPVSFEDKEANTRLSALVQHLHVWFGMESIMVTLMALEQLDGISHDSRILDAGCGNGYLCESLRAMGYTHVVGIDKSEAAVSVADALRVHHEAACRENGVIEVPLSGISFEHGDLVTDSSPLITGPYDVVIDKGTLDAVGMETATVDPDPDAPPLQIETVSQPAVDYAKALQRSLAPGGYILLVSCAFNKEEVEFLFPDFDIVHDLSSFFENGLYAVALKQKNA